MKVQGESVEQEVKNILVLGNGFDLYHGFRTRYTDFINACIQNESDRINSNSFVKYFKEHQENDNWIDFEYEIENIIRCFVKIIGSVKYISINDRSFSNVRAKLSLKDKVILKHFSSYITSFSDHCVIQEKYFNSEGFNKRRLLKDFKEELDELILGLEHYLQKSVIIKNTKVRSPQLMSICFDQVINFNYTHTYSLYDIPVEQVHFVHGRLRDTTIESNNNMVLGIQDIDCGLDFIYFKKFFQRIQKHIPQINYNYLQQHKENEVPIFHVHFFGHSLSKTDGDIIERLFNLAHEVTIFYLDQFDYEQKNN